MSPGSWNPWNMPSFPVRFRDRTVGIFLNVLYPRHRKRQPRNDETAVSCSTGHVFSWLSGQGNGNSLKGLDPEQREERRKGAQGLICPYPHILTSLRELISFTKPICPRTDVGQLERKSLTVRFTLESPLGVNLLDGKVITCQS